VRTLGQLVSDQGVGMTMPHTMLRLQHIDQCHVLKITRSAQDAELVLDRLTILLLDGGEVRRRAFDLFVAVHF
jgi:hypothetical protein